MPLQKEQSMFHVARTIVRSLIGASASLPLLVGGATIVSLSASPAASAVSDPGPIQQAVQQCVEQIATSAERTRNRLEARAAFAVQRIANLDANDAPAAALIASAREASQDLDEVAGDGARRINRIAFNCVQFLNQQGATQGAIQAVLNARSVALASIEAKHRQSKRAVRQALREALEDEDLPGDD
jgi:hypothetical protein